MLPHCTSSVKQYYN